MMTSTKIELLGREHGFRYSDGPGIIPGGTDWGITLYKSETDERHCFNGKNHVEAEQKAMEFLTRLEMETRMERTTKGDNKI